MIFFSADRVGHGLLDSFQSHHDLGISGFLFRDGLFLQLRHRRYLCRFSDEGDVGSEFLVHDGADGDHIDNAGAGVAVLFRGRLSDVVRSRSIEAEIGANAVETEPGRVENAVRETRAPFYTIRIRFRAPGRFWQIDHVRENHAKVTKLGVHDTWIGKDNEFRVGEPQH